MANTNRQPTIIYIFGGSGDLTQRKLIPALYNLYIDDYLPQQFRIIGIGRNAFTDTAYRAYIKKGVQEFSRRKPIIKNGWNEFVTEVEYATYDLTADKTYTSIGTKIKQVSIAIILIWV